MSTIFETLEKFEQPSTLLWRGIELKLVKEKLQKIITNDMVILDLGCGEGIVAGAVFDRNVDIGLDNELEMVEKAKLSGVYKKVILGSATKMPIKDKSIDLIFSNSVVEHIEDIDSVLSEIKRVLKKDGVTVLTLPSDKLSKYSLFSRLNLYHLALWYGRRRNVKFNHYNSHSINQWKILLEEKSLTLVDSYSYLSKVEAEKWDTLLITFYVASYISPRFAKWIYSLIRPSIVKVVESARINQINGAAICLIAKA